MKRIFILLIVYLVLITGSAQNGRIVSKADIWVKEQMSRMTLEDKIGQIFMIIAYSKGDKKHYGEIESQINKYKIGGICFFQGDPVEQARITTRYQNLSKTPMLIAIDGEWGLGMRFPKKAMSFPRQLTLGAIEDDNLIYRMGTKVADHCKRIGVNVNFAPVVDVNNNPKNPVINNRSFGENKYNVAAKGFAYAKGMQDNGIMACAKHFPGHGDTSVDSHYDLPIIRHDRNRLDSLEIAPFKALINQNVGSIMVAHLSIPSIDHRSNRPTTLSDKCITDILKNDLGFQGLVFTDAMDMKGVTKHFKNGMGEAEAFLAGNDIILLPNDIALAIKKIKGYLDGGLITRDMIDGRVEKILRAKHALGLHQRAVNRGLSSIGKDIHDTDSRALVEDLYINAITCVANKSSMIPIHDLTTQRSASLSIGTKNITTFQNRLASYMDLDHFKMSKDFSQKVSSSLIKSLNSYDRIFISLHDMSKYASKNFGVTAATLTLLNELKKNSQVILTVFGSPYSLKYFEEFDHILLAYEENDVVEDIAAQAMVGVSSITGKLPVTASPTFHYGKGIQCPSLNRLGYTFPERMGFNVDTLRRIDSLVNVMIKMKAAPGCQIICARKGKVIYQQAFGHHTYNKNRKVTNNDIYDVASLTKVMATTLSLMKLQDQQRFNVNNSVVDYIVEADTTNKKNLIIKDILAHHAGLRGWIPFYKYTQTEGRYPKLKEEYYRKVIEKDYSLQVSDNLFLRNNYQDTIWKKIFDCSLRPKTNCKYSDLGFYIMHRMIQNVTGESVYAYAKKEIYSPLQLHNTGFLPLAFKSKNEIAPTEIDKYFRNQTLQGHVHDMGAAMLGGISGHAGLFSNTYEMAVLGQMLLNGGTYGGERILSQETIKYFTTRHPRSTRRGIGFDMKELNLSKKMNMSKEASPNTYGHLGFTGTCIWVDPDSEMVFVILSNRTYPSMKNNSFGKENFRPKIQEVFYDALEN